MALAFTGPGSTDAINLGDLKHCRWLAKDVFTIFGIFKGLDTFNTNHNPLVTKQASGLSQFFVRIDDGTGTENFEIGNTSGLIDLGSDSDVTLDTWYAFAVCSNKGSVKAWLLNLQMSAFAVDGRTSTHGSDSADLTASIRIASRHDAAEFFEGEMCHVASVEYAVGRHDVIAYARDPAAWLAQLPKWLIHFYLPMEDEDVRDHGPHQIKPTVIGTVVRAANPKWGWLNGTVPLAEYWRLRERAQFRQSRAPAAPGGGFNAAFCGATQVAGALVA